jgi:hypothetical protein
MVVGAPMLTQIKQHMTPTGVLRLSFTATYQGPERIPCGAEVAHARVCRDAASLPRSWCADAPNGSGVHALWDSQSRSGRINTPVTLPALRADHLLNVGLIAPPRSRRLL